MRPEEFVEASRLTLKPWSWEAEPDVAIDDGAVPLVHGNVDPAEEVQGCQARVGPVDGEFVVGFARTEHVQVLQEGLPEGQILAVGDPDVPERIFDRRDGILFRFIPAVLEDGHFQESVPRNLQGIRLEDILALVEPVITLRPEIGGAPCRFFFQCGSGQVLSAPDGYVGFIGEEILAELFRRRQGVTDGIDDKPLPELHVIGYIDLFLMDTDIAFHFGTIVADILEMVQHALDRGVDLGRVIDDGSLSDFPEETVQRFRIILSGKIV